MTARQRNLLIAVALLAAVLALALLPGQTGGNLPPTSEDPDVTFTLRTDMAGSRMHFVGEGGDIDGQVNPSLSAQPGDLVRIDLINGDGAAHDIAIPDLDARSKVMAGKQSTTSVLFRVSQSGEYDYLCTLPGHAAAGMQGKIHVGAPTAAAAPAIAEIAHDPTRVGEPVGARAPRAITFDLATIERPGPLDSGTTYHYWTFNSTVPGPFLRARVGDTITVNLSNPRESRHTHSVDFHAVTGPGGGAEVTQVAPGETRSFTFSALKPGLYVYHCATPMVAQHISSGMYGLILVEPEGGLSPVDREFYVMQGEFYTASARGHRGEQILSPEKLLNERPEYFTFNGTTGALTETHRMEASVGETVRIYFGVGGPNATSSFHVIGEIFDRVYDQGSLTSPPLTDVQTTTVAPGGATLVEFEVDYPGRYMLVDHALSRVEKGLVGFLHVSGGADPAIFKSQPAGG